MKRCERDKIAEISGSGQEWNAAGSRVVHSQVRLVVNQQRVFTARECNCSCKSSLFLSSLSVIGSCGKVKGKGGFMIYVFR